MACVDLWNFWEEHQFGVPQGYTRYYYFTASLHHSTGIVEYLYGSEWTFRQPQALIGCVSTLLDNGIATGGGLPAKPNRTIGIGPEGEITYFARFAGFNAHDPSIALIPHASFQATCLGLNIWTGSFDYATIAQHLAPIVQPPPPPPTPDPTFMTITAKLIDDKNK
jgi:hypothetical protein